MPRRRMIQFDYKGKVREALELHKDERMNACWVCYQVSPEVGVRSFKIADMRGIREIKMDPRAAAYVRYDDLYDLPANYACIPEYTLRAIRRYVEFHEETGGFLKAVLSNQLQESFSRADDHNLAAMQSIVMLVFNRVPAACHGSPEAYEEWLDG